MKWRRNSGMSDISLDTSLSGAHLQLNLTRSDWPCQKPPRSILFHGSIYLLGYLRSEIRLAAAAANQSRDALDYSQVIPRLQYQFSKPLSQLASTKGAYIRICHDLRLISRFSSRSCGSAPPGLSSEVLDPPSFPRLRAGRASTHEWKLGICDTA